MHPLLSIITVTRNCRDALRLTLDSVKNQTCALYEQIVIDGASTDGTPQVARQAGMDNLKVLSEPDKGIYDAMNKGLRMAQGDYVMFLNAGDTLASPDVVQHVADASMDDYPGIIYGQTRIVDPVTRRVLGERHLRAPEVLELSSFSNGMVVCHQAFIALRKLTSPYNTRYRFSADYEWCVHVLQRSKRNTYLPEVIVDYAAQGATTANRWKSLWERFTIMCRYYGIWTTVTHHARFIPRYLKRARLEKKWK